MTETRRATTHADNKTEKEKKIDKIKKQRKCRLKNHMSFIVPLIPIDQFVDDTQIQILKNF